MVHQRLALGLLLSLAVAGCSDDDQAGAADADLDAFDLCPAQITYQTETSDWLAAIGISPVTMTEDGNPSNQSVSAPNGRAVLCLDSATTQINFVCDSAPGCTTANGLSTGVYFNRVDVLSEDSFSPDEDFRSPMIKIDDAGTIISGVTLEQGAVHVLVDVVVADGSPAIGASATFAGGGTAYVRNATGDYVAGNQLTDDSQIFIVNAGVGGSNALTVVPPPAMTCAGPPSINTLTVGALTHVRYLCQ